VTSDSMGAAEDVRAPTEERSSVRDGGFRSTGAAEDVRQKSSRMLGEGASDRRGDRANETSHS
jgi:hypothetical protein